MKPIITRIAPAKTAVQKKKVAAYCRVSTDHEDQMSSLENQRAHYMKMIQEKADWECAEIYCDAGLSGTKRDNRPELSRMLDDCRHGKIDLIMTKSISRFARNTEDCLRMIRMLTELGVNIVFEKENLSTSDEQCELILTILAALAEDESHSISENCKWTVQKNYQAGTFRLSRPPFGYDLVNGKAVINEEEAEIVRYIFDRILQGDGTCVIAETLNERGIPTKRGGKWHAGTIQHMITNVFYIGDLLMQKTWRDSQYRVRHNHGEVDQYYLENHHPAIISRETFQAALESNRQRGKEKNNHPSTDNPHQNTYCMTGKMVCGVCGNTFKRQTVHHKSGIHAFWVCKTHHQNSDACTMGRIWEEDLQHAFINMLNKLSYGKKMVLVPYLHDIQEEEKEEKEEQLFSINQELQRNKEEKHRLRILYSKGRIEPFSFFNELEKLKMEYSDLSAQKEQVLLQDTRYYETKKLIDYIEHDWGIPHNHDFPEKSFTDLVDHIEIHQKDEITFVLKCGLSLEESILHEES